MGIAVQRVRPKPSSRKAPVRKKKQSTAQSKPSRRAPPLPPLAAPPRRSDEDRKLYLKTKSGTSREKPQPPDAQPAPETRQDAESTTAAPSPRPPKAPRTQEHGANEKASPVARKAAPDSVKATAQAAGGPQTLSAVDQLRESVLGAAQKGQSADEIAEALGLSTDHVRLIIKVSKPR
jgi:hypothetical protein